MNLPHLSIDLKRILVPVDFSDASRRGLRYAASLAGRFGAGLDLLYVIEPPSYPAWGYAFLTIRDTKLRKAAEGKLPQFVRECDVPKHLVRSVQVCPGDADTRIVEAARKNDTDLIIMASHGLGTLRHRVLGSTTERVVRHAPCPVLVVREGEHNFVEPEQEAVASR